LPLYFVVATIHSLGVAVVLGTVPEYSCTAVFIYSLCVYYYTGVPYRYLASRYR
jgi:hypothetical protein